MLRRTFILALLMGLVAVPAHAQGTELMPGVTFEKTVQFTPHGAVVLNVLTAPKPGGLYQLGPVLSRGTVTGAREPLTRIERDVSTGATVAGINGDLSLKDGTPAGIVVSDGALVRPPVSTRSSIGIDTAGALHVERVRFVGFWKGTGQREPLTGLNQATQPGRVNLFTSSYGGYVPGASGSVEAVLQPFPAAAPNTDLVAPVVGTGAGGGETIPPNGAVLQATGSAVATLQAEAKVGTSVSVRLVLQPTWDGVDAGLGGGPVLVRDGKAVFRSGEDFSDALLADRAPRAGIGQLADGRIILVAVDGDQPGYSAGMTSFELAQAMQRLGAVSASAVASEGDVSMAFDGSLLDRPVRQQPIREALLIQYTGVYAPPLAVPVVNGDPSRSAEPLQYKLVRPSKVTAELVGPDGVPRVLESGVDQPPGVYPMPFSGYDADGTWHWRVEATDDLGRTSTADRPFRYDTTLHDLVVPASAQGTLNVRFVLSRAARVGLKIETQGGIVMRETPAAALATGSQQLTWDGLLPQGTRAYAGSYIVHLVVTSAVGISEFRIPFTFHR
jgi:hypothetical protein